MSRRRRMGLGAAVAAVAAMSALLAARPVAADYATVSPEVVAWEWAQAATPGSFQVTDTVVRDDGWMVVATAAYADGFLHLVPPWGGRIDVVNRLGSAAHGFRQLEVRQGRLFGLRQDFQHQGERTHNHGQLLELDPNTGEVVRDHGDWWFQDLALDPRTGDLVLQTSGGDAEPYAHHLVRYDPDRRTRETVVADDQIATDHPFEVAFSADGQRLFTANVTDVPATIDVREPDGRRLHTLQSGQVDSLTAGRDGTCFEGLLLLTRSDGSVWAMSTEPNAAPVLVAGGGRPLVVSYASLGTDGNLAVSRYADVTLLACPPFVPPQAPARPTPPAASVPEAAPAATVTTTPADATPAPPSGAPAPPAPLAAPTPPPAPAAVPVAPPSALGGAVPAASAPSVGAADSPDEEHITSVAASPRGALGASTGAAVLLAFAAYALVLPSPKRSIDLSLQRARGAP